MLWVPFSTLPDLRNHKYITLDLETEDRGLQAGTGSGWPTRNGHICGIAMAWREGARMRSIYIPIAHPGSANIDKKQLIAWLRGLIASGVIIITHNGSYDWGWLRAAFDLRMPLPERLEDTTALASMIDENRLSYRLDALCAWQELPGKNEGALCAAIEQHLGIKVKPGAKKNPPQQYIAKLPAESVSAYAEQDAVSTLLLWEKLDPVLDQEGTRSAYRTEIALLPMAQEMRARGIRIDVDAASAIRPHSSRNGIRRSLSSVSNSTPR
jgi:DNA polymerase I-like protein with 3'-5' exonuclease and polymerase domains